MIAAKKTQGFLYKRLKLDFLYKNLLFYRKKLSQGR